MSYSQTTALRHEKARGIVPANLDGDSIGVEPNPVLPLEEKSPIAKKRKTIPPEVQVGNGLVDLVGRGLLTQKGAASAAKVYCDALSPIFRSKGLDIYLPKTFYSILKKADVSNTKGMLLDVCPQCCHVYFEGDQDETTCPQPKCGARRDNVKQCLLFDVKAQIQSLMADYHFAKSHHYAAEFRDEGDGDIWDGDVLREWTSEQRSYDVLLYIQCTYTKVCTLVHKMS